MQLLPETGLASHHTFGLHVSAKAVIVAETISDFLTLWREEPYCSENKLVLGKGSNVLFIDDVDGMVVLNRIKGIAHRQTESAHYLHVGSGEDWPAFVAWTIERNIAGLENLALIPGCVGSSPIQNIGAYGLEVRDVIDYVDALNLHTGEVERLNPAQCNFGYRDSIFKHQKKHSHIIVAVGFRLTKNWQPRLNYGPLQALNAPDIDAKTIYQHVCDIRNEKLPDPREIGNAGSFFKNPVISADAFSLLKMSYSAIPHYPQSDGSIKLAAGWLIDQCQLKGYRLGNAQVHPEQALVLTNLGGATAADLLGLAAYVVDCVQKQFGIQLEHEVRFYSQGKETQLAEVR
ncbi:UDP-N-acetylmuramate dehydrogenase [Thaumasiovibrio sp. DFM-14]|uniref:UDP-N-acetylmuramate dehydrogenase n=1 Tax=Thaumasiovibrio sp. DFM-14 TaxID=3384792 RepID=UPI0039A2DE5C